MPKDATVVVVSREQMLERLAEIDAILDMMGQHDEMELIAERSEIAWLLNGR